MRIGLNAGGRFRSGLLRCAQARRLATLEKVGGPESGDRTQERGGRSMTGGHGSRWRIDLFGDLRATCGTQVITRFDTRKVAALLAFLAYHPDRAHPRELVMEILWPEEDPDATRVRLRTVLA